MFVIVKGSKFQAAQAAADRGIPLIFHREHTDCGIQTSGVVPDQFWANVAAWFCELPRLPPFPVGSCLHYSQEWGVSDEA